MYGIRPWKGYQARFEKLYSRYLTNAKLGEAEVEKQIKASPEYQQLDARDAGRREGRDARGVGDR